MGSKCGLNIEALYKGFQLVLSDSLLLQAEHCFCNGFGPRLLKCLDLFSGFVDRLYLPAFHFIGKVEENGICAADPEDLIQVQSPDFLHG